jgi:hypothetical protein
MCRIIITVLVGEGRRLKRHADNHITEFALTKVLPQLWSHSADTTRVVFLEEKKEEAEEAEDDMTAA